MLSERKLILASASPRRRELLTTIGINFEVVAADIDETLVVGETPEENIRRLSLTKAQVISERFPEAYVLGADMGVVIDQEVLGKPTSPEHAKEMLQKLQGRTHQVVGAFSIICKESRQAVTHSDITTVQFLPMSLADIEEYVATAEPMDKAGAYAIQGYGMQFIDWIKGSYTNVVGLNVAAVRQKLALLQRDGRLCC